MMMELMDCDLHRVIQSKQPLSEKHHKCFVKQILEAIKAMHAIGVFHRDLKPGNILVSKDCQVRITDFGLARFMDEPTRSGQNEVSPMTEYVVTRWYRCPELLLSPNRPYSEAIDLWSIGCILAELLRRKPLFPGKNHANQVQLIFEVLGYSGEEELGFPISGEASAFLDKRCRFRKQPLRKFIPDASDSSLALVESLLTVNPANRPSAVVALNHPFLADAELLNDYNKNYLQRPTVDYFNFEHEKFTVAELKEMIDQEVYSAAANAYRFKNNNSVLTPPNKVPAFQSQTLASFKSATSTPTTSDSNVPRTVPDSGSSHPHQLTSAHSQQALTRDESDGPASQLATQMKNTRLDKAKDNPFRNANNAPVANNRAPIRPVSMEAMDYNSEETKQQLQKFLKSESSDNSNRPPGPSGSILTAVRNDMGPPNTRGRKSVPKTPSPQKMDMILQKDYQNKQRIIAAGQPGQELNDKLNSARSNGSGDSNNSNQLSARNSTGNNSRMSRSTFPNGEDNINSSGKRSNGIADAGNNNESSNPAKRIGKLMGSVGMPFPSLTNRLKSGFTGGSTTTQQANGKAIVPNNAFNGDSYVYNNNYPVTINRSAAMVQTGSNIINHGDHYSQHN